MLDIVDLTYVYPDGTRALDNVTLHLSSGMFGLLGPNGAGKSTLMRCMATLQVPTSGSIEFDGADVIAQPEQMRERLGYLPQDFGVYPRVSAYAMLDHLAVLKGVSARGARRDTVETLLQQVNLWPVRHKALAGFSGGMRQRFGIAQALIGNPKLIIVDEPTAGLDPEERNRFLNLLAGISDTVVVVLSTHIVADVADLCRCMAVLVAGRVQLAGVPADLLQRLRGRVWRKAIDRRDLEAYRQQYTLISHRLAAGETVIHISADTDPSRGFMPVEGDLEDLYFLTLNKPAGISHHAA